MSRRVCKSCEVIDRIKLLGPGVICDLTIDGVKYVVQLKSDYDETVRPTRK